MALKQKQLCWKQEFITDHCPQRLLGKLQLWDFSIGILSIWGLCPVLAQKCLVLRLIQGTKLVFSVMDVALTRCWWGGYSHGDCGFGAASSFGLLVIFLPYWLHLLDSRDSYLVGSNLLPFPSLSSSVALTLFDGFGEEEHLTARAANHVQVLLVLPSPELLVSLLFPITSVIYMPTFCLPLIPVLSITLFFRFRTILNVWASEWVKLNSTSVSSQPWDFFAVLISQQHRPINWVPFHTCACSCCSLKRHIISIPTAAPSNLFSGALTAGWIHQFPFQKGWL